MSSRMELRYRCPKLGQEITLDYCLEENSPFPCRLIFSCWAPVFEFANIDLKDWLKQRLGSGLWESFVSPDLKISLSRLEKIIEITDQIKSRKNP